MEPFVVGILIAAIATIAGALVGAVAGLGAAAIAGRNQRELARAEADRRLAAERADRIRAARLDEVARTRRRLIHQIGMLLAAAVGKRYTALPAEPDEATNIGLLGSTELILEYRTLLMDLQAKLGAGISAEDQARATIMEVRVINALSAQEDRILRDQDPQTIPPDELASLIEPVSVAGQFLAMDQPPTIAGRIARGFARRKYRHPDLGARRGETETSQQESPGSARR